MSHALRVAGAGGVPHLRGRTWRGRWRASGHITNARSARIRTANARMQAASHRLIQRWRVRWRGSCPHRFESAIRYPDNIEDNRILFRIFFNVLGSRRPATREAVGEPADEPSPGCDPTNSPPAGAVGMAQRASYESSSDVGVFANLTNAYCLTAISGSQNFFSIFEAELAEHIPVIQTSIAGTRIVGRVTVGNKNGLIVPSTTTDQELLHLRNSLPEGAQPRREEHATRANHGPSRRPSPRPSRVAASRGCGWSGCGRSGFGRSEPESGPRRREHLASRRPHPAKPWSVPYITLL